MRLLTFLADPSDDSRPAERLGALVNEQVLDLGAAATAAGIAPGGPGAPGAAGALGSPIALLEGGPEALQAARSVVEWATARAEGPWWRALDAVRLRAPITRPPKILAVAGNYAAHRREGGAAVPEVKTALPELFSKPVTSVIGTGEAIVLPGPLCPAVDYEGELAVIIGRRCRDVAPERALDCVAGYANYNDVSGRRLDVSALGIQREGEAGPRVAFFDWLLGKWFDTFGACGPWLVTADEVPDPRALTLETRVNGEVRQRASTGDMLHSVVDLISVASRVMTLEPGDIIATGTPDGVGSASGRFLQAGDVVEVEIGPLGTLRNPVQGPR
ncbi:MAG TPA: fumarylacetoacetate hydrolase family protein [Chloroflexota bacterium]|nr:fumarylacetoacetate hydrolase family protein [Chloroflexota bacterium]